MWRVTAGSVAVIAVACELAACQNTTASDPVAEARTANQSRHVSERFEPHPVVIDDPYGFQTAQLLFDTSEILVVSDETPEAQLRAASIAVVAHAPLLVHTQDNHNEVLAHLQRMKVLTVLTVGNVGLAQSTGVVRIFRDPGGYQALGDMTTLSFAVTEVDTPGEGAAAVAEMRSVEPTWVKATWADPVVMPKAAARPFPVHSRRDADMAPVVVATQHSSIAAIANLRGFGARIRMVEETDPTESVETFKAMAGLADSPLIALGGQFGSAAHLRSQIIRAEAFY